MSVPLNCLVGGLVAVRLVGWFAGRSVLVVVVAVALRLCGFVDVCFNQILFLITKE